MSLSKLLGEFIDQRAKVRSLTTDGDHSPWYPADVEKEERLLRHIEMELDALVLKEPK